MRLSVFLCLLPPQLLNEPVLKKMLEGAGVDNTIARSPAWVVGQKMWQLNAFKPMGSCSITEAGPCSIADWVDLTFLIIFAIEMVIKMLAQGLMLHPNSYLRQGWNWLDFLVVIIGFIEMFSNGLPGISTLRLIKTLRPLRSLQRIRGMRVLVQCILEAMPQMCNVLLFLAFIIVIFGLLGCALFKGSLRHSCHVLGDDGVWTSTEQVCYAGCEWDEATVTLIGGNCSSLGGWTKQLESFGAPGLWTYSCRAGQECRCSDSGLADPTCSYKANPNYGITSFDSLPWAMVSLFQAISLEGWVDMMYQLMDGASSWVWIYFIILVLFGAIIVINLFLAVLCDNFEMADRDGDEKVKEESGEEATQAAIATLEHKSAFRQMCLNLVKNKYFDWFVQGCIVFNTLVMMLKYSPQPIGSTRYIAINTETDSKWDYLPSTFFWIMASINLLLTAIFTFESVVKIFALGPKLYSRDYMNIFDLFVVIFSIFEIVLDMLKKLTANSVGLPFPLSVLRAFRIFRLFKLVRSIESMRKIISTLATSLMSVGYLISLLGLIVLIFILLGMDLFGGYYPRPEFNYTGDVYGEVFTTEKLTWEEDDAWPSRYHFDDIGNAFLAIFVVLSGENWNEIMFNSHRATWDNNMAQSLKIPFAIIFFLLLFVIGNLLLFNLFIAILLSNFDDDDEEEEGEEDDDIIAPQGDKDEVPGSMRSVGKIDAKKEEQMMTWQFNQYMPYGSSAGSAKDTTTRKSNGPEEDDEEEEKAKPQPIFPLSAEEGNHDKSMHIFGWENPVRRASCQIITHWLFEPIVIGLILVSTGLLLFDFPQYGSETTFKQVMRVFNIVFAVIFFVEMLVKMVAMGVVKSKTPKEFVLGPSYFASIWNWLDFVIVFISILTLFPSLATAKPLRALRALRPLRLVSRYEDLKITVKTLVASVPAMGSLILVAFLFFIIFAILGLELYGGRLGYCMDPNYSDLPYGSRVIPGMKDIGRVGFDGVPLLETDYEECMKLSRYNLTRRTTDGILLSDMADMDPSGPWLEFSEFPQWMYPQFGNFDHMLTSLLLLFEISALEGWPDVMHVAMDSDADELFVVPWRLAHYDDEGLGGVGVPMELHKPQSGITALFFILWIFLGCFVVVNMTIGVVVDCFSQIKAENDGLLLMSEDAADWVKAQKQIFATRPLKQDAPPAAAWRLNVYYVVTSTKFELAVMAIILCNMLQMGCDWHEPLYRYPSEDLNLPELNQANIGTVKSVMSGINLAFLVIYVIEMVVKWIGLGMNNYFKNPWDCFDFILVLVSAIEVIISNVGGGDGSGVIPFPPTIIRVLRLFRVVRILRVIKTAKQLRTIIMTVWISVPQLYNIGILIWLIILIFDILAVNIFSFVNYTPGNYDNEASHAVSKAAGEVYDVNDYHWSDDGTNWGDMINRHANFQFWWTGMLTLLRSSTGESFNGIMHDAFDYTWGHNRMTCCPQCGPIVELLPAASPQVLFNSRTGQTITRTAIPEGSCGDTAWAVVIYLSFQMIMAYIVLSIMIGVILENFANVGSETRRIGMDDLEEFREVWLKYDPKGTFIVPSHNLLAILQQLKQPLGIAGSTPALSRAEMLKHLGKLDIPDHGGYIHFMETLTAVSHHHAGVPVPVCDTTKKMQKAANKVPHMSRLDKPAHNALTNYLVSLLQSRWRGYAMRKKYDDGSGAPTSGDVTLEGPPQQKVKSNQVLPEPQQ